MESLAREAPGEGLAGDAGAGRAEQSRGESVNDRQEWRQTPYGYRSPYPVRRLRIRRVPLILTVVILIYAAHVAAQRWPHHVAPVVDPVKRFVEHQVENGAKVVDRIAPGWRPSPTKVAPYQGVVSVVDGDTFEIHGTRIRLHGVDAPESGQVCMVDGQSYRAGQAAASALDHFIAGRVVACEPRGTSYGRVVAQCHVAGVDVAMFMALSGWAWSVPKYSLAYVDAERRARAARLGVWRGDCQRPSEYRAQRRSEAER